MILYCTFTGYHHTQKLCKSQSLDFDIYRLSFSQFKCIKRGQLSGIYSHPPTYTHTALSVPTGKVSQYVYHVSSVVYALVYPCSCVYISCLTCRLSVVHSVYRFQHVWLSDFFLLLLLLLLAWHLLIDAIASSERMLVHRLN